MAYLTYEEFKELSSIEIEEKVFNSLINKSSAILSNITGYFYYRNDIKSDNEWRVKQFKQALCAQIEYFHETDATTSESLNKAPQSFSAGRTTVTNSNSSTTDEEKSLVAKDVYVYLEGTGLLNRAVSVW